MAESSNYYETLGIPEDASVEEIRHAYHQAALRHHPDVTPGETELFLQTQNAYDVLSDPAKRETYDVKLRKGATDLPPVILRTLYSRSVLPRLDSEQLLYSLISIVPNPETHWMSEPPAPFHLCLVLDRSTSMQGERLDAVKTAAIELVRQLGHKDLLSIIAFSDRAEVIVPAERQPNVQQVATRIQMIRASGGTEIFQGLECGIQELSRSFGRPYIRHMVLLTDGRTYGDEQACLQLALEAAAKKISISGLGLGEDWNDDFLDELTVCTGGSSTYLPNPRNLHNYLSERVRHLEDTAGGCILAMKAASGVVLKSAFRLEPDPAPLSLGEKMQLGPLPRKNELRILLEFLVPPTQKDVTIKGPSQQRLGFGKLIFQIPGKTGQLIHMPVSLSRTVQGIQEEEAPPQPLVEALSKITLYRMQERARADVSEGNIDDGSRRLHRLASHLSTQGNLELAQDIMREVDNIQRTNAISAAGEKQIKYGTRALLPSSISENSV